MTSPLKPAVIYCRVSSEKQATEGNGLTSQESSCRHYAVDHGYDVLKVFTDDYTGGGDFWKRPGITALLEFLDGQNEEIAVIFDDLKRFARDTMFHLQLRQELTSRNAVPRCPNFRFEETPEGHFVETIIAATAELERKQNRRQVISRMKARFEAGYWVFAPPLGYCYTRQNGEKRLVPEYPNATIAKEALEGFASGKLPDKASVARFFEAKQCYSRWSRGKTLVLQKVERFLRNEIYSGWCTSKRWGLKVRGIHEPLISEETHRRIRDRLKTRRPFRMRRDARKEFPLRNDVHCSQCQKSLTGYWAQGRSKKYPYYSCQTPRCVNIRTEKMEAIFVDHLSKATPTPEALKLFRAALLDVSKDRELLRRNEQEQRRQRLAKIEKETTGFLEALARAPTPAVSEVYEARIEKLQLEKAELLDLPDRDPASEIEPVLEKGLEVLKNPAQYWLSGDLRARKLTQKLVFEGAIPFDPKKAYRTARFSLLYRLLRGPEGGSGRLVDRIHRNLNPVAEEFLRWGEILENYFRLDAGESSG